MKSTSIIVILVVGCQNARLTEKWYVRREELPKICLKGSNLILQLNSWSQTKSLRHLTFNKWSLGEYPLHSSCWNFRISSKISISGKDSSSCTRRRRRKTKSEFYKYMAQYSIRCRDTYPIMTINGSSIFIKAESKLCLKILKHLMKRELR